MNRVPADPIAIAPGRDLHRQCAVDQHRGNTGDQWGEVAFGQSADKRLLHDDTDAGTKQLPGNGMKCSHCRVTGGTVAHDVRDGFLDGVLRQDRKPEVAADPPSQRRLAGGWDTGDQHQSHSC